MYTHPRREASIGWSGESQSWGAIPRTIMEMLCDESPTGTGIIPWVMMLWHYSTGKTCVIDSLPLPSETRANCLLSFLVILATIIVIYSYGTMSLIHTTDSKTFLKTSARLALIRSLIRLMLSGGVGSAKKSSRGKGGREHTKGGGRSRGKWARGIEVTTVKTDRRSIRKHNILMLKTFTYL